jgi:hypothetical protein
MFHTQRLEDLSLPGAGPALSAELTAPVALLTGNLAQAAIELTDMPHIPSREEIAADMAANYSIPVANNFMLVPDFAPAGEEDEFIPGDKFTWYFWNGMIPYASSGEHVSHDTKHAYSYYRLFQSPSFAHCTRVSAGISFQLERSSDFAKAIDRLSDNHILLTDYGARDTDEGYGLIYNSMLQVQRLIRLREWEYSLGDTPLTEDQDELFRRIWQETGFAEHEANINVQLNALPPHKKAEIISSYSPERDIQ